MLIDLHQLMNKLSLSLSLCPAQMTRMLLDRGCNVNYLSKTGESPLHIMTKKDRFEAAMVLLTHGGDPNILGPDGNTALHLAMKVHAVWLQMPGNVSSTLYITLHLHLVI